MMAIVDSTVEDEVWLSDTNIIIMIEDEYPLLYEVVDENDLTHTLECYVNFGNPISPNTISKNFITQCTKFYPEELI